MSEIGKTVHCNSCGWTHFEVSAEYARKWRKEWVELCAEKDEEWLSSYGIKNRNPPTVEDAYGKCFRCGGSYKNFSDGSTLKSDVYTIQPILNRNEDLP